jgi:hypothetical protein
VQWLAVHVGAYIEQNRCFSVHRRRKNLGQRRTIYALKSAQQDFCRGHHRAGIAGADQSVCLPVAHQPRGYADGRVPLAAESLRGFIFHGDSFGGMNNFNPESLDAATLQLAMEPVLGAYQDHFRMLRLRCQNCALDFRQRRCVRSHCINSYRAHVLNELPEGNHRQRDQVLPALISGSSGRFFHQDCLPAIVHAAMGTSLVGQL